MAVGVATATVTTAGVSQAVTGSPSGVVGTSNFQPGTPNSSCAVRAGATEITADQSGEVEWVNGQSLTPR
jgi:hypothetical protein